MCLCFPAWKAESSAGAAVVLAEDRMERSLEEEEALVAREEHLEEAQIISLLARG